MGMPRVVSCWWWLLLPHVAQRWNGAFAFAFAPSSSSSPGACPSGTRSGFLAEESASASASASASTILDSSVRRCSDGVGALRCRRNSNDFDNDNDKDNDNDDDDYRCDVEENNHRRRGAHRNRAADPQRHSDSSVTVLLDSSTPVPSSSSLSLSLLFSADASSSPPRDRSRLLSRRALVSAVGSLAVLAATARTQESSNASAADAIPRTPAATTNENANASANASANANSNSNSNTNANTNANANANANALPTRVEVPLEYVPTLSAYVVRYTLFGEDFAAVVDTGSPFLTVPSYCRPYRNQKMRWGCYRPERTLDSGYSNTVEGFDNNYGTVVWRKADFSFPNGDGDRYSYSYSYSYSESDRYGSSDSSSGRRDANGNDAKDGNTSNPNPGRPGEAHAWAVVNPALAAGDDPGGNCYSELQETNQPQTQSRPPSPPPPPPPPSVPVVFGVLGEDLLNGSGGVFFGLIRETDRWIRPSFLGQTGYTSFCVDLRRNANANANTSAGANAGANANIHASAVSGPRLVLSKTPLIAAASEDDPQQQQQQKGVGVIPLVRDLRKRYGAPVVHYTAKASRLVVNGLPLLIKNKRPLYVIFDTGVSGMVVSQDLFDGRYLQARKNREKSLWGTVSVAFETVGSNGNGNGRGNGNESNAKNEVVLSATKPLATPLGKAVPWKGFRGNLLVLGLAFLDGRAMTVDTERGMLRFDD